MEDSEYQMLDNDWMSFRSRTEDDKAVGRGLWRWRLPQRWQFRCVFRCVCVCAGKLTSSTLGHIQVQAVFYSFYICIVRKWLRNYCQLTYRIADKRPAFCRGATIRQCCGAFYLVIGSHYTSIQNYTSRNIDTWVGCNSLCEGGLSYQTTQC